MATLPSASVFIDDQAGAFGGGTGYAVVLGCAALNADVTPRVFASSKALLAQHGYVQAADYCAEHFEEAGTPVIFVGLPIVTPGAIASQDNSGVTGTSSVSAAAATGGIVDEVDGIVQVTSGGVVGTDQISIAVSCDGGVTFNTVRLGAATSYTIPYLGVVINFATGGTLVEDDVFTFRATAPMWDGAGLTAARLALGKQLKLARSFMVIGEVPNATFAGYVETAANTYETANERFVVARTSVKDLYAGTRPGQAPAKMSKLKHSMTDFGSLTFAEVGATGDTITRTTGSWVTDGFAAGDLITVAGTVSNNFTDAKITAVTATILTLDTQDVLDETITTGVTVIGSAALDFAEVGLTGDTLTRSSGSWITDGFAVGDTITITGTASNNITGVISALSATVITFDTEDLAAESIASHRVSVEKSQTMAAWVAAQDAAFSSIDGQKRIDISIGRGRKVSPITGWSMRRPAAWFASVREYQHDLQIPCWRKSDGPLDGVSMKDTSNNVVEYDERTDGGALAARFTCLRTYGNGPDGAFIALSLTRNTEGSLLSRTHNMAVANLACTVVQAETENAIGQVLVLKDDGTGTDASLALIESRVNSALQVALLQDKAEGKRASSAVWRASKTDILNIPGAELTGVLDLQLNGTLEKLTTSVRIKTAGA